MVLVGSGCVDDRTVIDPPDMGDTMDMGSDMGEFDTMPPPVPLKASVCDIKKWDVQPDAKDLDLHVVATANGGTVVAVPKDGGVVRGFRVDHRGDMFDADMQKLREDRNYTGAKVSVAGDRLVVASTTNDTTVLDIYSDDLVQRHELGEFAGSMVTNQPMLTSRANHIALTGGADGLVANPFAQLSWEPAAPVAVTEEAVTSIAAAPFITDTILAWSTASNECHVRRFSAAGESSRPFACNQVRIAMNESTLKGQMVYVESGEVFRSDIIIGAPNMIATKVKIGEGSSPRVAFDGTRFWVSFLDAHGTAIIGFVDTKNRDEKDRFVSRALEGMLPAPDAYDLSVFSGGPWIVNTHSTAFGAVRMCAKP
jgi:hypothetical protein